MKLDKGIQTQIRTGIVQSITNLKKEQKVVKYLKTFQPTLLDRGMIILMGFYMFWFTTDFWIGFENKHI